MPLRTALAGRAIEPVVAHTEDGLAVRGWLVRNSADSDACVVLVAGIRGNRLASLSRATWYLQHGWSTLLVDLRGTGESDAAPVSMGFHEARDLAAWLALLRQRGFRAVGAHGQSLGAAAIVYGALDWRFVVLEACYGDVASALENRLPWVPLPALTLWPMRAASEWLMGVAADRLRPIDAIRELRSSTLFLCGDRDEKVGAGVTEALLEASGAQNKRFVAVSGAGHLDLFAFPELPRALAGFVPPPR
ncbi:MAG: hypothetical protein ABIP94_10945 [Planctomycetota bacterium]